MTEGWRIDDFCAVLPPEPPGPPIDGGPFRLAQTLLRDYRIADPSIVRAHYDRDAPLEGRDMLLELRHLVFRTFGGCRVGRITDERRTVDGRPVQVWGWPYQTLKGHIEQGEMSWEVWKWLDTGEIQFRVHSYSRMVGSKNPFTLVGVWLFGQRQRRRYLTSACRRIRELTIEALRGTTRPAPKLERVLRRMRYAGSEPTTDEELTAALTDHHREPGPRRIYSGSGTRPSRPTRQLIVHFDSKRRLGSGALVPQGSRRHGELRPPLAPNERGKA